LRVELTQRSQADHGQAKNEPAGRRRNDAA
jgi:hypothetical protein